MLATRVTRTVALLATAAAGMLAAHELDYRLVVPDPTHRHDLLLRTGHGYWSRAAFIALAAALLAACTAAALGFARGRGARSSPFSARETATRLALVQSGAFVLLEAVERLMVGAPPDDRLWLVGIVGVAVQIVVAVACALVLLRIERFADAVARVLGRRRRPRGADAVRGWIDVVAAPRLRIAGPSGIRGPPSGR